jgi:hypothetical protein
LKLARVSEHDSRNSLLGDVFRADARDGLEYARIEEIERTQLNSPREADIRTPEGGADAPLTRAIAA